MELDGRVALVTGGASGIGRETAMLFARQGAKIALADIDAAGLEAAAGEISDTGGEVQTLTLDVTGETAWEQAVGQVVTHFGSLQVLVNAAGVELMKSIAETGLDDFHRLMAVNVDGVFLGTKYALPAMQRSGSGSIVNISSIAGINGYPNQAAYCASKGAVRLLTKACAMEAALNAVKVRINSVHPGVIDTPMARAFVDGLEADRANSVWQRLTDMHPLGRVGEASEIAEAILYLASDRSSFMTGTELIVDGGITAR